MSKSIWLMSSCVLALASPSAVFAQAQTLSGAATTTTPGAAPSQVDQASPAASAAATGPTEAGDIVVTATRRASPLSDVPIAVSAITAESLQNTGATDLRQLNQVSPSLLVSSTSSEAGAGGARIRGIGTVGDNAGLESSVATFIDGVYRNRAGVGLTELGPIERVEVLRGPQGTLFGRNASAGLINVVTARPKFQEEGYAEGSYGNYDYYRIAAGFTGPIGTKVAYRLDGVYAKRDGFLKDVVSGRRVNNRDRYLIRGKLLLEPTDAISVMLSGDYTNRHEECCAATFQAAQDVTRNADGSLSYGPSSIAALERGLTSLVPGNGNGIIRDDTYNRRIAITPGRNYRSNVRDWGGSGEVNWDLGAAKLTSITAYRDFRYLQGQDADFNNLDLLYRADDGGRVTRFRTFSQELRLQGSLFNDKLDWLVGGYYAHERLDQGDNLSYGVDYNNFITARIRQASPLLAAFPGLNNLNLFTQGFVAAQAAAVPAAVRPLVVNAIAGQVQNIGITGTGIRDQFKQVDTNYAAFTHNIFNITDTLSLTLGARYTRDQKDLDANLNSTTQCAAYAANITRLRALATSAAAAPTGNGGLNGAAIAPIATGVASLLANFTGLPCVGNSVNGTFSSKKKEGEWSGTAVLSWKPTPRLLTYASYSRGYKAGGFNLDRAPLFNPATLQTAGNIEALKFQPEKVDSFEVGSKFKTRGFSINVAAFYAQFQSFQLNTFNGTSFFVTDIRGCKDDLGTTDSDLVANNSQCSNFNKKGVTSKGFEIESFMTLAPNFTTSLGFTYADTKYGKNLAGTADPFSGNNSLQPALFLLPGGRLSNSSQYVVTGAATWTPPLTDKLRGLAYVDFRYTSEINTGSDLFIEKAQPGVMVVNARLGFGAEDKRWSIEGFAQNLTNVNYKQVAFNATLQGSNTSAAQTQQFGTPGTQLFGAFLAEPRTYGVTVRTKF